MIALDTNVVVRFLTRDDAAQAARARRLVEGNEVMVAATVLLETEWVLRAAYGFAPQQIHQGLLALLGIPTLHSDAPDRVSQALDWYASGMDFADALHLAFSQSAERFATFDGKLVRFASRIEGLTVVTP
ncbi:MAG: type II toxin-antitoxin system VapC family toxin [Burkholderiales bacterium]|nr:type II toxin-antitoxin system VapC family toxin [Burkholderiales bacterium]